MDLGDALRRVDQKPLRDALERAEARGRQKALAAAALVEPDSRWIWRGVWAPETTYQPGDLVEHEGSTFLCVETTTGDRPPSAPWELVALRGERGMAGPGVPGPPGTQGPPGPQGPAGAGGTPSDAVQAETTFGLSPDAGTSDEFSRGDHTHGSPDDPGTDFDQPIVSSWMGL